MTKRRRGVAVVGGGPAGLAAAWRLAEAGHDVRLYEASSRPGGRLRTDVVAGRGADVAVQLLSTGYTATLGLLDAMGLGDRMVPAPGRDALWRSGRAHPLRYGSVTSMAASGALPAGLKVRLGLKYAPFLERRAGSLDLNDPAAGDVHARTIADWGAAEMGGDFVEWLAYPLLSAYYGVTPEETSAGFFHALARAGLGVEVVGARGGFGALAEEMSAALSRRGVDVRTDAAVRELAPVADGVRVATDEDSAEHDAVVVALPPRAAAALVPDVPLLDTIRSRPTAVLVLATRRPVSTGWFGLSIPRTEPAGATLAAVCVQAEKETGVVGTEGGSLVLVPAPAVGERWAAAEAADVVAEAMATLRDALGDALPVGRDDILEARLVRLEDAVWLPDPDHFARLAAFRHDSLPSWLALAGDYLVAPTVEGAVRSGLAAADRAALNAGSA